MKINIWTVWLLATILVGSGCSQQQQKQLNLDSKPSAIGNAYQTLVVSEAPVLKSDLLDSIDFDLAPPYLVVPNYESELDLDVIESKDFLGYLKQRRSIVFVGTLDGTDRTSRIIQEALGKENILKAQEDASFRFAMRKEVWADGQRVFYLFAPSRATLGEAIGKAAPAIIKAIHQNDRIIHKTSAYAGGVDNGVITKIKEKLNINIDIPKGYRIASEQVIQDSTVWLRYDAKEVGYNILIHTMPYSVDAQLKTDNLIAIRNEMGKRYVRSTNSSAYMTTELDNRPLPVFETSQIGGAYALEARGLWKMVNDYMGGPFISYMVYDPNTQRVVFIDGFIQAPAKERHRDYVERLKTIMESLTF